MNNKKTWLIYYLGENEDAVHGFSYRWSNLMTTSEDLLQFVKDSLYGGDEPEADMFFYDEYLNLKKEAIKEPFDFVKVLFPIVEILNDIGCQVNQTVTLHDLMTSDEAFCQMVRKSFRTNVDAAPLPSEEQEAFLLSLDQDLYIG